MQRREGLIAHALAQPALQTESKTPGERGPVAGGKQRRFLSSSWKLERERTPPPRRRTASPQPSVTRIS